MINKIISNYLLITTNLLLISESARIKPTPHEQLLKEDKDYWYRIGEDHLRRNLERNLEEKINVARNVIVFLGDGMGVATITATRIYKGQREFQKSGEEHNLIFDEFPNVGLIKTYNVDMQIPDSAATATALFTGVKTNYEVVGLDARSNKSVLDLDVFKQSKLDGIMTWAQNANKLTGVVTTARITHATPAAIYAHANDRNWECDGLIPPEFRGRVKDIGRQLIEDEPGRNFRVILGGGYQQLGFDVEKDSSECSRLDGRNLTETWLKNRDFTNTIFARTTSDLSQVSGDTDYLLGLFHADHIPYELLRDKSAEGQPSLKQMTAAALKVLDQDHSEGFALLIEGGRIDHAHHKNQARLALEESAQFEETIRFVANKFKDDTLIIVTADHSHTMTLNGYARRGNDVLGYGISSEDNGKKPALTLSYTNGPGFGHHFKSNKSSVLYPWLDPRDDPDLFVNAEYEFMSAFDLKDETHGGEDVAIFGIGPGSHLIRGVMEQSFVAHLISYSACIGPMAYLNLECDLTNFSNGPSEINKFILVGLVGSLFVL